MAFDLRDQAAIDEAPGPDRRSVPDPREAILDAVAAVLVEQKRAATEMQAVVERSGVALADVDAAFADIDDLLIALVTRVTAGVVQPLGAATRDGAGTIADVRATLLAFGTAVQEANATIMVGLYRVGMTEGSRRRSLRHRFYEEGPAALARALSGFLQRAVDAGVLTVDDCALAAEQLIGMLREPLYQEIALHSQELTFRDDTTLAVRAAVDVFLEGCDDGQGSRHGR